MKTKILIIGIVFSLSLNAQDTTKKDTLLFKNYWELLLNRYVPQIQTKQHCRFTKFYKAHDIDSSEHNMKTFFTLGLLHEIFRVEDSEYMSTGRIIDIPHVPHWCHDNPRLNINCFLESTKIVNGTRLYKTDSSLDLKDIKPPKRYSQYDNFAMIDRTPYIFLWDIARVGRSYSVYHDGQMHSFESFGWCSEREMAFSCLLQILGYNSTVIMAGNHAISAVEVFIERNGEKKRSIVIVDNTHGKIKTWYIDTDKRLSIDTYYEKLYNKLIRKDIKDVQEIKFHSLLDRLNHNIKKWVDRNYCDYGYHHIDPFK